jgi:DNA primase
MSVARNVHGGLTEVTLSYYRKYCGDKGEYFLTPEEAMEVVKHKDHGFREACERLAESREPDRYEITG